MGNWNCADNCRFMSTAFSGRSIYMAPVKTCTDNELVFIWIFVCNRKYFLIGWFIYSIIFYLVI